MISQLIGTITEATAGRSSQPNNITNTGNIRGWYFLYFDTIGANPFGGFGIFERENNNPPLGNNNNNLLPPLSSSEFGEGFNPPSWGNSEGLDPNIAALVNALTGANLRINHIKKESNYIKLTEFEKIKVKDSNE